MSKTQTRFDYIKSGAAVATIAALALDAQSAAHLEWERQANEFIKNLQDEDPEVRYNTWNSAGNLSPKAIPMIAKLLDADQPGIAKAGEGALDRIVYSSGKDLSSEKAKEVQNELLGLTESDSRTVKVYAIRMLSLVAGDEAVEKIAAIANDPAYAEEAIYALERIPGRTAAKAIVAAANAGTDAFKMRCIAAIGNRKDISAVEDLAGWMASSNNDVALAAMDATAKIGEAPEESNPPEYEGLSYRQKRQFLDAALRFFSAKIQDEDWDMARMVHDHIAATDIYKNEEHYRCATIAAIAHLRYEDEARQVLNDFKDDPAHIVRVTAQKAIDGKL
jgi:hypothetical protein